MQQMLPAILLYFSLTGLQGEAAPIEQTRLGTQYLQHFEFLKAELAFAAAARQLPGDPAAHFNLALAHYYTGSFEAAREVCRTILKGHPGDLFAHFLLGILEVQQNHFQAAAQHFQRVLDSDQKDVETIYQLGLIELRREHLPAAIDRFRSALEMDPRNLAATYNLARSLLRNGRRLEATSLLDRFRRLQQARRPMMMGAMSDPHLLSGRYAQPRPLAVVRP